MSMSTHVIGFRPPDEKWKRMRAVWYACVSANVEIPNDVAEFFNYDEPDDAGVEVDIENSISPFEKDMKAGFQIDIKKLPENVEIIRFYNSW
jgi:hypothetical protein